MGFTMGRLKTLKKSSTPGRFHTKLIFCYSPQQVHVFNFSKSFGRLGQWNVEISSNPKPPQSVTLQTQSCASNREFKTLFSHFTSDQRKCGMLALALNFNQFNSKYMKSKCISRTSEPVTKRLASSTLAWQSWFLFRMFQVPVWSSSMGLEFWLGLHSVPHYTLTFHFTWKPGSGEQMGTVVNRTWNHVSSERSQIWAFSSSLKPDPEWQEEIGDIIYWASTVCSRRGPCVRGKINCRICA